MYFGTLSSIRKLMGPFASSELARKSKVTRPPRLRRRKWTE